jgi:hypothetical protein
MGMIQRTLTTIDISIWEGLQWSEILRLNKRWQPLILIPGVNTVGMTVLKTS